MHAEPCTTTSGELREPKLAPRWTRVLSCLVCFMTLHGAVAAATAPTSEPTFGAGTTTAKNDPPTAEACEALLAELRSSAVDPVEPQVAREIESCALEVDGFFEGFRRYVGDFARDTAETAMRAARVSLELDNPEEALERFEKASSFYRQAGDAAKVAEALTERAELHLRLDDAEAAWKTSREAGQLYEELGALKSAARAWELAASAGEEMGALLEKAAWLYRSAGAHGSAGALLLRVGRSRMDELNNPQGALAALRQAQEDFEAAGDAVHAIHALALQGTSRSLRERDGSRKIAAGTGDATAGPHHELALLLSEARQHRQRGELEEALAGYRSARSLLEGTEAHGLLETGLWLKEGELLSGLGRSGPEILAYRRARRRAQAKGQELSAVRAWTLECDALGATGQRETVEECLRDAEASLGVDLEIPLADSPWRHVLATRAERYWHLAQWDKVLEIFNRAEFRSDIAGMSFLLEFWRGMFDASWEAALGLLADLPEGALTLFQEAKRVFESEEQPVEAAQMGILEAVILMSRGHGEDALGVLAEVERSAGRDRFATGLWHFTAALIHPEKKGRQHLRQALPWLRSRRSASLTPQQSARSIEWLFPFSQELVRGLHEEGRPREALLEAEAARTRAFLDMLANEASGIPGEEQGDLETRRQKLEEELAAVEASLRAASPPQRWDLVERRGTLDRELDEVQLEYALRRGAHPEMQRRLHLGELDAVVEASGPVLYYFVSDPETLGYLLLPGVSEVASRVVASMHWRYLENFAEELSRVLANPVYESRAYDEGREWWDRLIGPFADQLPRDGPLTIVPHGPLHTVPFSALVSPRGEYLGERYALSVAPSLSALQELVRRHRPLDSEDRFLALASGRGLRLPRTEVQEVARRFDPERMTLLKPEDATFDAYRTSAPEARQILIASRAVASPGRQRLTYVELEGDRRHDSRLTAAEIADVPLEAELVTLAACDTARAEPVISDEHLDLSRAFLLAGSAAVLATRWKLSDDHRTSLVLQDFYRIYRTGGRHGQGTSKAEALRRARIRSRKRGDPAQTWAAWVLVGDGR